MKLKNDLEAIKRIFIDYPRMYEIKKEELIKVSSERQDILHALEFGKLNAIEMSKLMRDLKEVQIRRRQIKDNLEVLDEIKRFAHNKIRERDLTNLINKVHHIIDRERNYKMRVRTDLQEVVEVDNNG